MRSLRTLLVFSEPDDTWFMEEVLAELPLVPFWRLLKWSIAPLRVDYVEDAIDVLRAETVDLAIVKLSIDAVSSLDAFLSMLGESPHVPFLVIADPDQETLALSAVREGAQDYLITSEIDCALLARSIRYSVERKRMEAALRSSSRVDDLTGMYKRSAFLSYGERDLRLLRSVRRAGLVSVLQFGGFPEDLGREERDLMLLDFSEWLRGFLPDTFLAGRIAESEFALLSPGANSSSFVHARLLLEFDAWRAICPSRRSLYLALGAATGGGTLEHLLEAARASIGDSCSAVFGGASSKEPTVH